MAKGAYRLEIMPRSFNNFSFDSSQTIFLQSASSQLFIKNFSNGFENLTLMVEGFGLGNSIIFNSSTWVSEYNSGTGLLTIQAYNKDMVLNIDADLDFDKLK